MTLENTPDKGPESSAPTGARQDNIDRIALLSSGKSGSASGDNTAATSPNPDEAVITNPYSPSKGDATAATPKTACTVDDKQLVDELSIGQDVAGYHYNHTKENAGFLGVTFDFLKNNVGTSSEGHDWYHPAALWSNIFDSESGSEAIDRRMHETDVNLSQAETLIKNNDCGAAFQNAFADSTYKSADGTLHLKSQVDAADYDSSQANGVEGLADASVVAAVLASRGAGGVPTQMALGGTLKAGLKYADGQYSNPGVDFSTGAFLAAGMTWGRTASIFAAPVVAKAALGVGLPEGVSVVAASTVGSGLESSIASPFYAGPTEFFQGAKRGDSLTEALTAAGEKSAWASLYGFGAGAVLGPMTGMGRPTAIGDLNFETPVFTQNPAFSHAELTKAALRSPDANAYEAAINAILKEHQLPEITNVKLADKINDGKALGRYTFYSGKMELSSTDPLLAGHELTHHEQSYLRLRLAADQMNIGATIDQTQLKDLATKLDMDPAAAFDMITFRNGVRLNPTETARAEAIGIASDKYTTSSLLKYNLNKLEREAHSTENSFWSNPILSSQYAGISGLALEKHEMDQGS